MSKLGAAFTVDDITGEVTSGSMGNLATKASMADASSLERNSADGKLRVMPQGASLATGVPRTGMSKFAGTSIIGNLTANDAAAGVFDQINTYGSTLLVWVGFLVTTKPGACTIDVGVGVAAASYDTLMDGLDVNPGKVVPFARSSLDANDNGVHAGGNGKAVVSWAVGEHLTASMATGATAGLVGRYVIHILDIN